MDNLEDSLEDNQQKNIKNDFEAQYREYIQQCKKLNLLGLKQDLHLLIKIFNVFFRKVNNITAHRFDVESV